MRLKGANQFVGCAKGLVVYREKSFIDKED